MNAQVKKLYEIAQKNERLILGLMSGTSLDGLDLALCRIKGHGQTTDLSLEHFLTMPYEQKLQNQIRQIFAQRQIDQSLLSRLHARIAKVHADMVGQALLSWGVAQESIDLIASHGQTVFHEPKSALFVENEPAEKPDDSNRINHTLQIGDGDHIAVHTGVLTISDFRQKHIAAGGEGAPLVLYGDALLYTSAAESRVLLNIGGIANFTVLPAQGSEVSGYATDIGPGNTLMNQYMQTYLGKEMDRDGALAAQGLVHQELLNYLLDHLFFKRSFPKTTGPELFNLHLVEEALKNAGMQHLPDADMMATLCAYTVQSIIKGVRQAISELAQPAVVYVSGGGLHNPTLMKGICDGLAPIKVVPFDAIGFNPDAKEAALFAVLANETIAGSPRSVSNITGAPEVCMGKISFPY